MVTPQIGSLAKTVWTMSALAVSFSPLLYKIIQQGYFVLAITGICTLLLAIITGTPLIRWTGYLVGGRYAAWVAYHFLLESQEIHHAILDRRNFFNLAVFRIFSLRLQKRRSSKF